MAAYQGYHPGIPWSGVEIEETRLEQVISVIIMENTPISLGVWGYKHQLLVFSLVAKCCQILA